MKNVTDNKRVNKVLREIYPEYDSQLKNGLIEVLTN